MNAVLGKKGYWGHCKLEQLMLLYLCVLHALVLDTVSRNRHFIRALTLSRWQFLLLPPILFLKVASFL